MRVSPLCPTPQVFIHSLALLEAQASSEIENIVTTTDELFRAETLASNATPTNREALRYREALFAGVCLMAQRQGLITVPTAQVICTEVRGVTTGVRADQGAYIGTPDTGRRTYTPPEGEQAIREKLDDWVKFANSSEDMDPLERIAVAQLVRSHPLLPGRQRARRAHPQRPPAGGLRAAASAGPLHLPGHHRPEERLLPAP